MTSVVRWAKIKTEMGWDAGDIEPCNDQVQLVGEIEARDSLASIC